MSVSESMYECVYQCCECMCVVRLCRSVYVFVRESERVYVSACVGDILWERKRV